MGNSLGHNSWTGPYLLRSALKSLGKAIVEPLLQLMDGKRFLAAPATIDRALPWRGGGFEELEERECETLPTLYAALAVGAAHGGEYVECCKRWDFERNWIGISGEREKILFGRDLVGRGYQMSVCDSMPLGAVLRHVEQKMGMYAVMLFSGKPLNPSCTLEAYGIHNEATFNFLPRPMRDRGGEFNLDNIACAVCQSPEHMQAARALEAGSKEHFMEELAAAATIMRAAWAAREGV